MQLAAAEPCRVALNSLRGSACKVPVYIHQVAAVWTFQQPQPLQGSPDALGLLDPSCLFASRPPTSIKVDLAAVTPAAAAAEGGGGEQGGAAAVGGGWWSVKVLRELLPPVERGNEAVKAALAELHWNGSRCALCPRCCLPGRQLLLGLLVCAHRSACCRCLLFTQRAARAWCAQPEQPISLLFISTAPSPRRWRRCGGTRPRPAGASRCWRWRAWPCATCGSRRQAAGIVAACLPPQMTLACALPSCSVLCCPWAAVLLSTIFLWSKSTTK